ncbi:MAG TPA: MFS transporter [Candidatus Onthosoma merdavium]|uniref:MFS transporter n=1 Tax=Massilicoli timonensis TaxID=2015901 RepID=A0ABT1SIB5_9FIRM|nr:MFS transporter [Massilicoli timonensis]MCQ5120946.1 MFS transporter [Massilicoli timonensis]HIR16007.1 MFS transporter [Candidatus Onthosoma merdavium]
MKRNALLYIQNFLAFFVFSYVSTQLIPFLKEHAFSLEQRGIVLALVAVIATIGQIVFGLLCDRYHQMKRFLLIGYLILAVSALAMVLSSGDLFAYLLLVCAMVGGFAKIMQGLTETYLFQLDQQNYPKLRAAGALGFTVGAIAAGQIVSLTSFPMLAIGLLIVSVLWLFCFRELQDVRIESNYSLKEIKKLFRNRRYLAFVFVFFMIYLIGNGDQYIVVDKMVALKASHDVIAIKWAVQSIMEVPLLLGANRLLKKVNAYTLLLVAVVMYGIKFFLYGFAQDPYFIIGITFLQVVTLPIVALVSKLIIEDICESSLRSSAQLFALAIFVGLSGLLTPLISSALIDWLGYDLTLYVFAAANLAPFAFLIGFRKKLKPQAKA